MKRSFFIEGELLVLPDGKILAHNITPEIAAVLSELDPKNELMKLRMTQPSPRSVPERISRDSEGLTSLASFREGRIIEPRDLG